MSKVKGMPKATNGCNKATKEPAPVNETRESSPAASDDDSSIDPEVLNMMMPLAPNTSSGVSCTSSGGGGKNNRPSGSRRDQPGRWTTEEHLQFLKGLELYGKSWKKISSVVKTRTVVQIRTHAQKYLIKQDKAARTGYQGVVLMDGKALANNKKRCNGGEGSSVRSVGSSGRGVPTTITTPTQGPAVALQGGVGLLPTSTALFSHWNNHALQKGTARASSPSPSSNASSSSSLSSRPDDPSTCGLLMDLTLHSSSLPPSSNNSTCSSLTAPTLLPHKKKARARTTRRRGAPSSTSAPAPSLFPLETQHHSIYESHPRACSPPSPLLSPPSAAGGVLGHPHIEDDLLWNVLQAPLPLDDDMSLDGLLEPLHPHSPQHRAKRPKPEPTPTHPPHLPHAHHPEVLTDFESSLVGLGEALGGVEEAAFLHSFNWDATLEAKLPAL